MSENGGAGATDLLKAAREGSTFYEGMIKEVDAILAMIAANLKTAS